MSTPHLDDGDVRLMLREQAEQCQKRHERNARYRLHNGTPCGPCLCGNTWPCPDRLFADAVAKANSASLWDAE